jgi:hypothetical protein
MSHGRITSRSFLALLSCCVVESPARRQTLRGPDRVSGTVSQIGNNAPALKIRADHGSETPSGQLGARLVRAGWPSHEPAVFLFRAPRATPASNVSSLPPPRLTINVSLPSHSPLLMDSIDALTLQPPNFPSPLDVVDHRNRMNTPDPTTTARKLPRVKRSFKHVPGQSHFLR